MIHNLKTWPGCFEAVRVGDKKFEVRENDRNFQLGDTLILQEFKPCPTCKGAGRYQWDPWDAGPCTCSAPHGRYTGRSLSCYVTFTTDLHQKEGYIVMGIDRVKPLRKKTK